MSENRIPDRLLEFVLDQVPDSVPFDEKYKKYLVVLVQDFTQLLNSQSKEVQALLLHIANEYLLFNSIKERLSTCESEIEKMMFLALQFRWNKRFVYDRIKKYSMVVHQQWEVKVEDHTYRTDFLISFIEFQYDKEQEKLELAKVSGETKKVRVIVECDGHDFHEKSKEHVQKDKLRDRQLQKAGYDVLRFTGSEIYRNPEKCADEIISFGLHQLSKL